MPLEVVRVWTRVTNTWVERLQDIGEEQLRKEGIFARSQEEALEKYKIRKEWMLSLSNRIKNQSCYGWQENPWVQVIAFERCGKPVEITENL